MKKSLYTFLIGILLIIVVSACGSTTKAPNEKTEAPEIPMVNSADPTATDEPTKTAEPSPTPTSMPAGMSRSNPLQLGETYTFPNWEVSILEVKRGDEAWADIQAANMFNEPAKENMQYILIKVHAKSLYSDSDTHSLSNCDFDITGSSLKRYSCGDALIVAPDPQLDASLYSGGETEGWIAFSVPADEANMMLVFNESFSFESDSIRYIALDPGAVISVQKEELNAVSPNDLGLERQNPAPKDSLVITEDWSLNIIEVKRGDEALQMALAANQFNDPPEQNMEYVAVKIHAKYLGLEDSWSNISSSDFDITGDANTVYDSPYVVEPDPVLNFYLFPGGEAEGWIILQASANETGLMLIFDPLLDFSGQNKRFISIQ